MQIKILNNEGNKYKDAYIGLMTYCFRMCTEESFQKDWENTSIEEGAIFGSLDEEEVLASSITVLHKSIFVNGKKAAMGGIGAVTTAGQYRSGGVCSNLIKESLKYMKEKEMVFSMLAPFSYPFYQKFGWKCCYEAYITEIPMLELRAFKNKGKFEPITAKTKEDIAVFYDKMAQKYNGTGVRTDKDWEKALATKEGGYGVVYKNGDGTIEGYMLYKIMHHTLEFNIKEILFATQAAATSLLNFAYAHEAQANKVVIRTFALAQLLDILPNPRLKCTLEPGMMGRIIDVLKAMYYYDFNGCGNIIIKINDDTCEWNNKTFKVEFTHNEVTNVVETKEQAQLEIDIRELTQLILGFRTLQELKELERVKVLDEKVSTYFKPTRSKSALYDFF